MQLCNGTVTGKSVRKLPCSRDLKHIVEFKHREFGRIHEQKHGKQCSQLTVGAALSSLRRLGTNSQPHALYNNYTVSMLVGGSPEKQAIEYVHRKREIYCKELTHMIMKWQI